MKAEVPFVFFVLVFILLIAINCLAFSQTDSMQRHNNGRETFRTYCSSCHSVHKEIIGPMLASIPKKRTKEWLTRFIRNSQQVIVSGDQYANFLYQQYKQNVMPAFKLSDSQISEILFYIKNESQYPQEKKTDLDEFVLTDGTPNEIRGKQIFQNQCATCHFLSKENLSAGPALGSVSKRRPRTWLLPFIKNSQKVIHSGDPYAVNLFNSFDRRIMVSMDFLTDEDINAVLDYIEFASSSTHAERVFAGRQNLSKHNLQQPESKINPEKKENQSLFKVLMIIASTFAAIIFSFLIVKLFQYLQRANTNETKESAN
jgi:mono/diheme cytochrome c family protein